MRGQIFAQQAFGADGFERFDVRIDLVSGFVVFVGVFLRVLLAGKLSFRFRARFKLVRVVSFFLVRGILLAGFARSALSLRVRDVLGHVERFFLAQTFVRVLNFVTGLRLRLKSGFMRIVAIFAIARFMRLA